MINKRWKRITFHGPGHAPPSGLGLPGPWGENRKTCVRKTYKRRIFLQRKLIEETLLCNNIYIIYFPVTGTHPHQVQAFQDLRVKRRKNFRNVFFTACLFFILKKMFFVLKKCFLSRARTPHQVESFQDLRDERGKLCQNVFFFA